MILLFAVVFEIKQLLKYAFFPLLKMTISSFNQVKFRIKNAIYEFTVFTVENIKVSY